MHSGELQRKGGGDGEWADRLNGSDVREGKDGMCRSRNGRPGEWLQQLGMVSVEKWLAGICQ